MAESRPLSDRLADEFATGEADFDRETALPGIPPPGSDLTSIARAVQALKTAVDTLTGSSGTVLDKALTTRDLLAEGALGYSPSAGLYTAAPVYTSTSGGSSGGGGSFDPLELGPYLSVPPTPTNLTASGTLKAVILDWDLAFYRNHAYTEVYRATVNNSAVAVAIAQTESNVFLDSNVTVGVTYYYWVKAFNGEGTAGALSLGASGGPGIVGNVDLGPLIVEAGNLASGAVTAAKLADAAVGLTKFASGIEPISVVGSLPSPAGYTGAKTVFLTTDGKLYRYTGGAWVATVPAADVTGQLTNSQLAAIDAAKVSGQLTNSQLAAIDAAKVTGQLTGSQIADAAITTAKFAAGIEPVEVVSSLPGTGNFEGRMAYLTTDNKLYRHDGTNWIKSVDGADITASSIVAGKIAAGAIGATEIAAGSILATKLTVSDNTNLYPDFDCEDAAFYASAGGASYGFATTTSANLGRRYVNMNTALAGSVETGWFPIETSADYWLEASVSVSTSTAGSGTATAEIEFGTMDAAGVVTPTRRVVVATRTDSTSTARLATSATAASTERRARFVLTRTAGTSTSARFGGFTVRRRANANLVVDGAITTVKIAANAVTANEIAAGTITAAEIAAGAITTPKLAAGAVTANEIAAGAIVTAKLAAGAVTATEIASGAVTTTKLAADAVTANELAANAVTAGKIAAGAVSATQIAAGAVTADKLLVTGRGAALNTDPMVTDTSAWTVLSGSGLVFVTGVTDLPAGGSTALANTSGVAVRPFTAERIEVDSAKAYRAEAWLKLESGTTNVCYFCIAWYSSTGAFLQSNVAQPTGAGSPAGWASNGTYSYGGIVNATPPGTWTRYAFSFGAGETAQIPSNARFCRVGFILNNASAASVVRVSGVRLMEKAAADLIVDGAITATKIAANAIAVGSAAIQNGAIVNAMIGNLAVDSAKIADGAIVTAKIGDAQITTAKIGNLQITDALLATGISAGKITTGTLDAGRIAAGSLDAGKITSGTITSTQIQAGGISADRLSVSTLSAIQANTGALSVTGALTIGTNGNVQQGKTTYASTTAGFWLGNDAGTPKFHVGNSSAYLRWTGTQLEIQGAVQSGFIGSVSLTSRVTTTTLTSNIYAGVRFNTNGTVETSNNGTTWTAQRNYYLPTTAGVGTGRYIRVTITQDPSSSATVTGAFDSWAALNNNIYNIQRAFSVFASERMVCAYEIATDAAGTNVVSAGFFNLYLERTP